jgi:RHS repeat-associated protein
VLRGDTATSAFQGYWPSSPPAPAGTRVMGFDGPLDAASGSRSASSSRTPSGSSCSYGELASGRQKVTNLRLPGQYDERLLGSVGLQGPYYNWNRWYLPSVGRYLELDPLALRGGFNGDFGPDWYGYAEGNPLRYVDPLGLTVTCTYSQSTGLLQCKDDGTGQQVVNHHGWSGMGPGYANGYNNPAMQCVAFAGPLPAGSYTIGTHQPFPGRAPPTLPLTPSPSNNMCGRKNFWIHGANLQTPLTSSEGCIIMPPPVRNAINNSGGGTLTVVP